MSKTLPRSMFVRVLCLLLCAVLLACFFMVPRAQAFAAEAAVAYGIKELIAAILVAGGVIFATSDDARAAAGAVFDFLDSQASSALITLSGIVSTIGLAGSAALGAGVLISASLWDALADAFGATGGYTVVGSSVTFDAASDSRSFDWVSAGLTTISFLGEISHVFYEFTGDVVLNSAGNYSFGRLSWSRWTASGTIASEPSLAYPTNSSGLIPLDTYRYYFRLDGSYLELRYYDIATGKKGHCTYFRSGLSYPLTIGLDQTYTGNDLVWPGEDTLVKAPDLPDVKTDEDTDQTIIVYPDLSLNPADHVADVPIDAAGDRVDVPTDTLVDVGTGEIVDTDVNPDVDVPDTPSGTFPKPADISIPRLIITKFPFCIPFDVARLIGLLQADPIAPVFVFPLKYGTVMDEEIVLDLSRFDSVIEVVRWGELVCFVAALAYVTRNYIKW